MVFQSQYGKVSPDDIQQIVLDGSATGCRQSICQKDQQENSIGFLKRMPHYRALGG